MPDRLQAILNLPRAIASAPTAYKESGMRGVAEAFSNPAPFEQAARTQNLSKKNQGLLDSISQTIELGDANSAYSQIMTLREQLSRDGTRPGDVDSVTGPLLQKAFAADVSSMPGDTPQGQRNMMRANAIATPERAANIAAIGAELPAARAREGLVQAQTRQSDSATAGNQVQAEQVYPAQANQAQASADYYNRRPGTDAEGGATANTMANVMARGRNTLQGYDKTLEKSVQKAQDMQNPAAVAGMLEARNFAARQVGAPEFELTMVLDPVADPKLPIEQRQMYALAVKKPPEPAAADPRDLAAEQPNALLGLLSGGSTRRGGGGVAPPEMSAGGPLPVDQGAGPSFEAAVGNPLGALPEALQLAIADPKTPVPATSIQGVYQQMGFSPEQSNQLVDFLMAELMGSQGAKYTNAPTPAAAFQQQRDPFQPAAP